jgi:hypothetical protein
MEDCFLADLSCLCPAPKVEEKTTSCPHTFFYFDDCCECVTYFYDQSDCEESSQQPGPSCSNLLPESLPNELPKQRREECNREKSEKQVTD